MSEFDAAHNPMKISDYIRSLNQPLAQKLYFLWRVMNALVFLDHLKLKKWKKTDNNITSTIFNTQPAPKNHKTPTWTSLVPVMFALTVKLTVLGMKSTAKCVVTSRFQGVPYTLLYNGLYLLEIIGKDSHIFIKLHDRTDKKLDQAVENVYRCRGRWAQH